MPIFKDVDDFVFFIRYCQSRLYETPQDLEMDEDEYDELKSQLSTKLKVFEAKVSEGRGFPANHEVEDFVVKLNALLPKEDHISLGSRKWANDWVTERSVHGLEQLKRWMCSPVNCTFQHEYSTVPEPAKIHLQELKQGDRRVWVGGSKAKIIDSIGSVPYIDAWIENRELSRIILSGDHAENQWQRAVKLDRVMGIAEFLDNPDAYLANGIMIYADLDHPSISFDGRTLTVEYNFLKQNNFGCYSDHDYLEECPDLRPIWIIDGQHRTRGAVMSERGSNMELPLVLCVGGGSFSENGMTKSDAAKMFSEINTQSKQLAEEHQLYAGDRFSIPSVQKHLDFSESENGEKNRFAYHLAARLCSDSNSPLYNRIRMMPKRGQRESNSIIVEIKTWMGQVRKWNATGLNSIDDAHQDAMNYFSAFADTLLQGTGESSGWGMGGKRGQSLFENKGPFNVILELYPEMRKFANYNYEAENKVVSVDQYASLMKPWTVIDFTNQMIKDALSGRDENIKHICTWLLTAMYSYILGNNVLPTQNQAISDNIYSTPNQGLLSVPNVPVISEKMGHVIHNQTMIITGEIPYHCKQIAAYLNFEAVTDAEGIVKVKVEHEKMKSSKMVNLEWDETNPRILRRGSWNLRIKPLDLSVFDGPVSLHIKSSNFIGDSEEFVLRLRD